MNWQRILIATLVGGAVAATTLVPATPASAKGDNTGTLGSGGVAKGDISKDPGETDRVQVDLDAGATIDVTFSASFDAAVSFTDPDGFDVDLGNAPGTPPRAKGFVVPKSGTYDFTISSADGAQGLYTLVVKQKWARTFTITGSGSAVVDVAMPALGRIGCVATRVKDSPGQPIIVSLKAPDDADLLHAPIQPKRNSAKLGLTQTTTAGIYRLALSTTDGSSAWTGKVTRAVKSPKPGKLNLANGLDPVSFAADGVGDVFRRQCAECHGWAASYSGARSYARNAAGRMRSGNMPPQGRVPADQIALVNTWIATGLGR